MRALAPGCGVGTMFEVMRVDAATATALSTDEGLAWSRLASGDAARPVRGKPAKAGGQQAPSRADSALPGLRKLCAEAT